MLLRCFDLSAFFPQFRLDVGKADALIDLLFSASGDRLDTSEDAVLIEFQSLPDRECADGDSVSLRPGKVMEGGAIRMFRYDPEIDMKTGAERYRRPGLTM